jgi:hypothetical protein
VRRAIVVSVVTAVAASNAIFLWQQRQVHLDLFALYDQIIAIAESNPASLGYVNVPAWLTPNKQTYALVKESAIGLALYSDVGQLVRVNTGQDKDAQNVMSVHTLYEPADAAYGWHGNWLDGPEMRQFALDRSGVYLVRHHENAPAGARFTLSHVGELKEDGDACAGTPLVRFEGGPDLVRATPVELDRGQIRIALTWRAAAPIEANVFLHVVDAQGTLVTQADGPALGGMLPLPLWQPGDCVYDVRPLDLSPGGGPFTVLVGVYDAQARLPAYLDGARAPNDAASIAQLGR